MTVAQLRRWLRVGLGRANLYLRNHASTPYRHLVLWACLHNWAYDKQCEGNRAEYMFDIIQLTDEREFYRESILTALATQSDDRDPQLYEIVRLFAQQGDIEARRVLYEAYAKCDVDDYANGRDLIALDGLDGLIFVANKLGSDNGVLEDDDWVSDYLYGLAEEQAGKELTRAVIDEAASTSPNVARYTKVMEAYRFKTQQWIKAEKGDTRGITYEALKPLLHNERATSLVNWGEEASEADLVKAAEDLAKISNEQLLRRYLMIFRKRQYPLPLQPVMDLVEHPHRAVAAGAIMALSNICQPEVRQLGLGLLRSNSWMKARGFNLLMRNFQDGDYERLEQFAVQNLSQYAFHDLDFTVPDYYKVNPNPESEARVLTRLYEVGPCTMCREKFVRRLIELGELPDWMCAECEWDANPDTRALVKGLN